MTRLLLLLPRMRAAPGATRTTTAPRLFAARGGRLADDYTNDGRMKSPFRALINDHLLDKSQVFLIALTEEFGLLGAFDAGFNQSGCLKGKGSATKSRTFRT